MEMHRQSRSELPGKVILIVDKLTLVDTKLIQICSENKMRHFFPILIVFCMIFASCATTLQRKNEEKKEKPEPVESKYGLLVTPENVEIFEVRKGENKDFDQLFAEADSLFDSKRYDEAKKLYRQIIDDDAENPKVPFCFYNIGLIGIKLMQWESAVENFTGAAERLSGRDKADALLNLLESLRKTEDWERTEKLTKEITDRTDLRFTESERREIALRHAEALIMQGRIDEGRKLADYWRITILKSIPRRDAVFIPELALAYYVLGRVSVKEFSDIALDESRETLEQKCQKIIDAQTQFLKSINVGIIFWTNASAYEIANLYMKLYDEMQRHRIPADLNDEEKEVYRCELWKKISNLLRKSRRTLTKSIESAKKINEENEYTEKSFELIGEIDRIYEEEENTCRN